MEAGKEGRISKRQPRWENGMATCCSVESGTRSRFKNSVETLLFSTARSSVSSAYSSSFLAINNLIPKVEKGSITEPVASSLSFRYRYTISRSTTATRRHPAGTKLLGKTFWRLWCGYKPPPSLLASHNERQHDAFHDVSFVPDSTGYS